MRNNLELLTWKGKRYASYCYRYNRFVNRIPFFGKYFASFSIIAITTYILIEGKKFHEMEIEANEMPKL